MGSFYKCFIFSYDDDLQHFFSAIYLWNLHSKAPGSSDCHHNYNVIFSIDIIRKKWHTVDTDINTQFDIDHYQNYICNYYLF